MPKFSKGYHDATRDALTYTTRAAALVASGGNRDDLALAVAAAQIHLRKIERWIADSLAASQ